MSNDFKLDFIYNRRSIRKYTNKPVTNEVIEEMLNAAMAAPSTCAKDPWRFIVVQEKTTLSKICEGLPNGKMLENAALGIVVCGDIDKAHGNLPSYMLQDCSAAIENLLIAAHHMGLGAVWLGVHPREERIEHIKSLFNLPENIIPISCISIGYPDEKKEARTRYNVDYVHYEKW